jgi:hypothetical protein
MTTRSVRVSAVGMMMCAMRRDNSISLLLQRPSMLSPGRWPPLSGFMLTRAAAVTGNLVAVYYNANATGFCKALTHS